MMGGYDAGRGGYADSRGSYGAPATSPRQAMPSMPAVGRQAPTSPARRIQLRIAKVEDKTLANQYIFGNL
jgi:vesicle-fusing ATPase